MPIFTVNDQEWTQITSGETLGSYWTSAKGIMITQSPAAPTGDIDSVVIMDEASRKATSYGALGAENLYARTMRGEAKIHVTKGA